MYYLAKIAQAAGLATVGMGFITAFPGIISGKIFGIGTLIFVFGWIVEAFLLKGKR